MKQRILISLILVGVICLFFGCTPKKNILEGYWEASVQREGHQEKYVYHFTTNFWGSYIGSVQSFVDQNLIGMMDLESIQLVDDKIKMVTRTAVTIVYIGKLSSDNQVIQGKLHYPDGTALSLNLHKQTTQQAQKTPKPLNGKGQYEYQYVQPKALNDGLAVSALSAEQNQAFAKMMEEIVAEEYGEIHSLLIAQNNKLIFEEYFYDFDANVPHHLQSVTKSITSLLVGIAMDMGQLEKEDISLAAFFPEAANVRGITLQHLLSMRSGWSWTPAEENAFWEAGAPMNQIVQRKPRYAPGEKFEYMNPNAQLFASIIKKATGMYADQFAQRYLFQPLGIGHYQWERNTVDHYPLCGGALFLRPRDMLKIGLMVLNDGQWNGQQVVSSQWINRSTAIHADVPNNIDDYGYLWWHGKLFKNEDRGDVIFASGRGGQFIFIFPEYEMVVVFTGGNYGNDKEFDVFKILQKYISPA